MQNLNILSNSASYGYDLGYHEGYSRGYRDSVEDNITYAHWEMVHDGYGVCSHCHRLDGIDPIAAYCRYCGARIHL